MIEVLRSWLNGKRDYFEGIVLHQQLVGAVAVFTVLKKGETPFTRKKLNGDLMKHFVSLSQNVVIDIVLEQKAEAVVSTPEKKAETVTNVELYNVCKAAADLKYKEVMNLRAVLFSLSSSNDFTDPNTPERILARAQYAIDVVVGYQQVSALYDKADFVAKNGFLPTDNIVDLKSEFDNLSDSLVKQTIDNIRKNVSKMKKREATPERLALIQQHQLNLIKLNARWLLLKPM